MAWKQQLGDRRRYTSWLCWGCWGTQQAAVPGDGCTAASFFSPVERIVGSLWRLWKGLLVMGGSGRRPVKTWENVPKGRNVTRAGLEGRKWAAAWHFGSGMMKSRVWDGMEFFEFHKTLFWMSIRGSKVPEDVFAQDSTEHWGKYIMESQRNLSPGVLIMQWPRLEHHLLWGE